MEVPARDIKTSQRIAERLRGAHSLLQREDANKALALASDALTDEWESPQALYLCGASLRALGHIGLAAQLFRRALAIEQRNPNLWLHYGACLHDMHHYDEAREAFLVVHKAMPDDPVPIANIGSGYIQQGRAREAVEWADRALAIDPTSRIANIAKGFGCLLLRRWADGWAHAKYLYGEQLRIRVYNPPEREEPEWDGSHGRTVVVQCDQGLGDQIMFAQCLKQMAADCKQVLLDCNPRLESLFRRSFPEIEVFGTLKEAKVDWPNRYQIDARVHVSWLGTFYRQADADFPRTAYLVPDPEKRAKWRRWLERFPRPWVGVAWQGGIPATNAVSRSTELTELAPILRNRATWIDMTYQDTGLEVARWNIDNHQQLHVPHCNPNDYDDTVALVAELDHVVTVTTTLAHVCGALGKRAMVLVPRTPAWRYGQSGEDMIWYPEHSLSLYRQAPGEDGFEHAIARLSRDFEAFVAPQRRAA